jgi:hypothetical protein
MRPIWGWGNAGLELRFIVSRNHNERTCNEICVAVTASEQKFRARKARGNGGMRAA